MRRVDIRRPGRIELLVATLLLMAFVLDILIVPSELLPLIYVIPMLVAAQRLSRRATATVAVAALLLYTISAAGWHGRLALFQLHTLNLLAVAYLSYLLAKGLEEARQAQAEAEEARQRLQRFLGMVAHELRGPLTSILGYAQFAARPGVSPEFLGRALRTIEAEGCHMERLIADLLDAARIGGGRFTIQPQPADLVELARRAIEAAQAASPTHRLRMEAPPSLVGTWDRDRLGQVVANLVRNAVAYSPDGGAVVVRLWQEDTKAAVSISDQGVGMRAEDLPLLFKPFSRLDAERGRHGTGLGLYISAAIVQAHNGRIWAASPGPGQGSTFSFCLPLHAPARASVPHEPTPSGHWPVTAPRRAKRPRTVCRP